MAGYLAYFDYFRCLEASPCVVDGMVDAGCMERVCGPQWEACSAPEEGLRCDVLDLCIGGCADLVCVDGCVERAPEASRALLGAVIACGAAAGCPLEGEIAEAFACLDERCPEAVAACEAPAP